MDKVLVEFQRLSETGNIAVIVAIAVVLLCYVAVLVIVRKFDMEDAKNVSVEPDFLFRTVVLAEHALQCNPFTLLIWLLILPPVAIQFFVNKSW